jgi:hypothetical protein
MSVRKISARYAGKCGDCGEPIAVGDLILYGGRGRVAHANDECKIENVPAGPTTRERREARVERLRGWSASNAAKADAAYAQVRQIGDMIPMGQPILVGHHSEGRHCRDLARLDSGMRKTVELGQKAESQVSRADNIEAATEYAIFDDDPDAIERLEVRIAELEAKQAARKARNVEYRKVHKAELKAMTAYQRSEAIPFPSYSLSNLNANIRRYKQRLARLQREAVRA